MNELMNLTFQGRQIRMVMRDGEPWWVARDVCEVLEISNPSDALKRLDEDDLDSTEVTDALGRRQTTNIVNESGLYSLILGSRKPEAREFKRWITRDVIPSIRRTGAYIAPGAGPSQAQVALALAQALVEQERRLNEVAARVDAIEARQRDAEQQLQALPAPSGPVADVSTRALLNRLIRAYSVETGIPHNSLWRQLYREFRDRYHVDLVARATGSKKPIDVAEEIGHIQTLYNLAATLFKRAS